MAMIYLQTHVYARREGSPTSLESAGSCSSCIVASSNRVAPDAIESLSSTAGPYPDSHPWVGDSAIFSVTYTRFLAALVNGVVTASLTRF